MTQPPRTPKPAAKRAGGASPDASRDAPLAAAPAKTKPGERIAKVLARAGIASRREAERLIAAGLVRVNGKVIDSPALDVLPTDRITIEGKPLPQKEPVRLWLYHKPLGLVTSAADEQGRPTVFENLPEDMPRVMSIGRLDLNSEGLLLLTNDGDLKRRLELPSTGWLRKYRVRVNGNPTAPDLEPLRKGMTIEGERFQPMEVSLDRVQGANAWLTVGLREGKNREVRRAMVAIGLYVNRLIRVSYGPFRLGDLPSGAVEEVRPSVLRDQLGLTASDLGLDGEMGGRPGPVGGRAVQPRATRRAPRDSDAPREMEPEPRPAPRAETRPERMAPPRGDKPGPRRTKATALEEKTGPRGERLAPRSGAKPTSGKRLQAGAERWLEEHDGRGKGRAAAAGKPAGKSAPRPATTAGAKPASSKPTARPSKPAPSKPPKSRR